MSTEKRKIFKNSSSNFQMLQQVKGPKKAPEINKNSTLRLNCQIYNSYTDYQFKIGRLVLQLQSFVIFRFSKKSYNALNCRKKIYKISENFKKNWSKIRQNCCQHLCQILCLTPGVTFGQRKIVEYSPSLHLGTLIVIRGSG